MPLTALDYKPDEIREMLDKESDNYALINEINRFSKRVNEADLANHYYNFDGKIVMFPEIAKKLNNGTFFEKNLKTYYLLKKLNVEYARYNEYPKP